MVPLIMFVVCMYSEIFKKIRIPYIVKKSKSMLVKQQIRNWLRICNRFNYIDRGSVGSLTMRISNHLADLLYISTCLLRNGRLSSTSSKDASLGSLVEIHGGSASIH